jgi:hypothetical protein
MSSSFFNEPHALKIPVLAAVLELGEGDRVRKQLALFQTVGYIKGDSVFDAPANHFEDRTLAPVDQFFATSF